MERELIKRRVAAGKAQIVRGLHAEGVTARRVSRERERKGVEGGADRDAKSFRDRDAVAFNGLYVICELGVGVAHQSQEIESVAVPVACCMLSM